MLTGGQKSDCNQAIPLIIDKTYGALLADKGYDSNMIINHVISVGSRVVIPPKRNRIIKREYDKEIYKERHKIERLFGFLKHYGPV